MYKYITLYLFVSKKQTYNVWHENIQCTQLKSYIKHININDKHEVLFHLSSLWDKAPNS